MIRKPLLLLIALLAVFGLVAAACGDDDDTSADDTGDDTSADDTGDDADTPATVLDLAVEAGQFSTLAAAIDAAGLTETLEGEGPFTVLAPTDAAFESALATLGISAEDLLANENLADILLYHVLPIEADSQLVATLDGQSVDTALEGETVAVSVSGGTISVNEAEVVSPDLVAENGIVHVINGVLLPPAVAAALGAGAPADDTGDDAAGETPTIRLRGQDFPESITIAEVYGQYLKAEGYDVDILTPAGFRTEAVDGLQNDDLDLIIDYIGSAQAQLVPDAEASADPDTVVTNLAPYYEGIGATLLDYAPAIDGNAFVVRGDLDATTISDVADLGLVLGASAQCPERPQCLIGLEDPAVYGIEFADFVTIEFGPLLGEALASETVDAVYWNTTAPEIEANGFKILEDDKGLFSADNIAPIISTEVLEAYSDELATDLNTLSAVITTEDLTAWNTETNIEFRESDDVATEWLTEKGLI